MGAGNRIIWYIVAGVVVFFMAWSSNASEKQDYDYWDSIWQRATPVGETVEVKRVVGLGEDIGNREWQMISRQYHQIYYQPSTDKKKVAEVYSLIDNIYRFLEGRSPTKLRTRVKTFLVPGEWGHSRCSQISNAMRTGDKGDVLFMLTSLLHEETHLFNFAYLRDKAQGWWTGEYTCIYYQQRALWQGQGKDIKNEIASRLPDGPQCHLKGIDRLGQAAFDEALSALYFLEEKYGRDKIDRFREVCLEESRRTNGGVLAESTFEEVFGQDVNRLEQQWLKFYGWGQAKDEDVVEVDDRLQTKISNAVGKASVQNIVQAMANEAGLRYNWTKSQSQIGALSRRWVMNVRVKNETLDTALKQVLGPVGVRYKLEEDAIVLYKR